MTDTHSRKPLRVRAVRYAGLAVGTVALGAAGAFGADLLGNTAPAQAENLSKNVVRPQVPTFADIVERVSPAVVSVRVTGEPRSRLSSFGGVSPFGGGDNPLEGTPFERFFNDRFGDDDGERPERPQRRQFSMGQGSGFFISEDGYVVTNNHVVDGASKVEVVLGSGDTFEAEVIGTDDKTDLALLKVDADRAFPFVTFNDDDAEPVRVGDWVMAVGNPFGLGGTVTAGIVSARGREIGAGPYDDFIQIDAPINRGNSGGPTFDLDGEVVGVNTAIYSPSGGSVGIGFAIPAAIAETVIEDLKDDGAVTRGWLGVQIQPITPEIADSLGLAEAAGALVVEPQEGSPADEAGLEAGDAILAVNGEPVEDPRDLARTISTMEPGSVAEITVARDGEERTFAVELGRLAAATERADAGSPGEALTTFGLRLAPAASMEMGGEGLAILEVDPEGPAAERGLRTGDVILSAGGEPVDSTEALERQMSAAEEEGRKNVLLKVQSGDQVRFVALPLDAA